MCDAPQRQSCFLLCSPCSNRWARRVTRRRQPCLTTATCWRRRSASNRSGGPSKNRGGTLRPRGGTSRRQQLDLAMRCMEPTFWYVWSRICFQLSGQITSNWLKMIQVRLIWPYLFCRDKPSRRIVLRGSNTSFWTWLHLLTKRNPRCQSLIVPCQSVSTDHLKTIIGIFNHT